MKTPINIDPNSQNIPALQAMVRSLVQERVSLIEQFNLAMLRQFGKSTESFKPYDEANGDLFNEAESESDLASDTQEEEPEKTDPELESGTTNDTKKTRGKRKPLPKDLLRERIVLDIPDEEKVCACCQGELHKIGEDISEKLEFVPAVLKILEYVRPKYACRHCEKHEESAPIIQETTPPAIIPKSYATESLLTQIILGKYQYALPLYRQEALFSQLGIDLSRTSMARWVMQVGTCFTPLYQALQKHLLEQVVVHADETPLNVLKEEKRCYMWVYCSGADSPEASLEGVKNIVLFDYQNSRARTCPAAFLGDYDCYLQTDGYAAYDGLPNIKNLGCFSHSRRKFVDVKKLQVKGKTGKADIVLAKIQKLYALEAKIKRLTAQERWRERQNKAIPILNDLHEYLSEIQQNAIKSSQLGKAINYTLNQWSKLIRYVEDGHASIDNNRAERAIKPFVIGRKNWLFSDTAKGANASAMLYSIIETAKANGLIVYDYFVKCMKELAKTDPNIDSLLPWNLSS